MNSVGADHSSGEEFRRCRIRLLIGGTDCRLDCSFRRFASEKLDNDETRLCFLQFVTACTLDPSSNAFLHFDFPFFIRVRHEISVAIMTSRVI